jgi:hypothetical protein
MRLSMRFVSASAIALALGASTVTAAGAEPSGDAQAAAATDRATSPMLLTYVTEITSKTPDADGNVNARLSNGAEISIPADKKDLTLSYSRAANTLAFLTAGKSQAEATLSPAATGSCGTSYILVVLKINAEPVRMVTGFTVTRPAVSYSWKAHVIGFPGSGYDYTYNASGNLALRTSWTGSHNSGADYPAGFYSAAVIVGPSFAILNDGSVCYSLGPTNGTYLS